MTVRVFRGSRFGDDPADDHQPAVMSSRDPVVVGRAARALIQSGHWQKMIANSTRGKVMLSLKSKLPWAAGSVHVDALLALTRRPPHGGCYWCNALLIRDLGVPELVRDAGNFAALGPGCQRCRTRWETEAAAAGVRALQAGGLRRRVTGPQPTGALWPAGREPAGLVASARKAPLPSYYTPDKRRPGRY